MLNMKSLCVGILATDVMLSAAVVTYCANDGVRHSPWFIMYETKKQ